MTFAQDDALLAAIAIAKEKGYVTIEDLFIIKEAVASVAIEHDGAVTEDTQ